MSFAFNKFSSAPGAAHYQHDHRQRIPQQQGVGQTLPPLPVGSEPHNTPPPPPGAMSPGTEVVVGRHKVVIQVYLAEGGFAHVYLVRMKEFPDPIVLKRIAVPDTERLKSVEKEIVFMRRLGSHKNIVRYFDSQVSPLPTGGFEALILMEYCPGGGVIDLMNRRLQQRLTEPEILKIFGDLSEALAYMHYCNPPALHRDLKVENILISATGRYKLCDFGSACLSKGYYVPRTLPEIQKLEDDIQRHTTLQYRAPEMIDIYQKRPINEKADIWALGVLLYKLCYYTTPFEEQGPLAILSAKFSFPTYPHFTDQTKNLITWLLSEDQDRRPNIYQVVEAVCKLRGKECPIRNIYTNVSAASSPQSHSVDSIKSANDRREPDSIFEQRVQPKQQTPDITPMRRGRPERKERDHSGAGAVSIEDSKSKESFDPFDPKSFSSTNHKQPVLDFDPAKIFSLNENTAFTSKSDVSDIDTKKAASRNSMPSTIPAQSSAPLSSTSSSELSQINNTKSDHYQRSMNPSPSTPDSFKSPALDTHAAQQLTGDNRLLQAALSGGQAYVPARSPSPSGWTMTSPLKNGDSSARDNKAPLTSSDNILTATKSPVISLKSTHSEKSEFDSKPFGFSPSKSRYESSPKPETASIDTSVTHPRTFSDHKMAAPRTATPTTVMKKLPDTPSRDSSLNSNNRESRFASSKSSFSDLVPEFSAGKEDTVETFNRKFPDLSSLDKQLSGSLETKTKSDGSAAFRALDQASKQDAQSPGINSSSVRPSALGRYQPTADQIDRVTKRSSISSPDTGNKGKYIQSKVMEQLQRFESANNERHTDLQSRGSSMKVNSPGTQITDITVGSGQASPSIKADSQITSKWRRSISQDGTGASTKLSSNDKPSNELAQMTKSIQNYRQMLQSPSPSPKDDEANFDFSTTRSVRDVSAMPEKSRNIISASPNTGRLDESISNGSNETTKDVAQTAKVIKEDESPKSSSPSPKPVPATQSGAYRPTPPPKPSRFRMSNSMAPVLSPSNATTVQQNVLKSAGNTNLSQSRPGQWMNREPSISDFESKFPSPEQLQQGLPKADSKSA